eukprot:g21726.t1
MEVLEKVEGMGGVPDVSGEFLDQRGANRVKVHLLWECLALSVKLLEGIFPNTLNVHLLDIVARACRQVLDYKQDCHSWEESRSYICILQHYTTHPKTIWAIILVLPIVHLSKEGLQEMWNCVVFWELDTSKKE